MVEYSHTATREQHKLCVTATCQFSAVRTLDLVWRPLGAGAALLALSLLTACTEAGSERTWTTPVLTTFGHPSPRPHVAATVPVVVDARPPALGGFTLFEDLPEALITDVPYEVEFHPQARSSDPCRLYVQRWDGREWVVTTLALDFHAAYSPLIDLEPTDGHPVLSCWSLAEERRTDRAFVTVDSQLEAGVWYRICFSTDYGMRMCSVFHRV